jgi:hypothetical protein
MILEPGGAAVMCRTRSGATESGGCIMADQLAIEDGSQCHHHGRGCGRQTLQPPRMNKS